MFAHRIRDLPPYLFAELDRKIEETLERGEDVIDLGVGDPDLPTPRHIVEACCGAADNPENHRYPSYKGMLKFRRAVAERYKRDYGVELDPEREVLTLIGSKEGIHNINFAFVDPGDVVLYPDPGYPVYRTGALFAGGETHAMPLLKENSFLPDLNAIPKEVARRAKLMWINYPNNPTASVAGMEFYKEVVDFAIDNEIVLCSDEAYSKIAFGYNPVSLFEVKNSREVGIVFDSLSKTYNMTGWRIAYAVGSEEFIEAFGRVKANIDSGASQIIQEAGVTALTSSQECVQENIRVYQKRRDVLVDGLIRLGMQCEKPKATFYLWVEVPGSSIAFADKLLGEADVVCTPGVGFGAHGEGYIRFSLTQSVERIKEALERLEGVL
ncbi:MAG: LL-diaminopimelate aminotransferase [Candidatus Hydrothermarchaeales archaeon]